MLTLSALTAPLAMAPPSDGSGGNPFMGLVPLIGIMFIFYFLVIRPQQKRHKEHQSMLASLKRGDRVVTNGGVFATIVDVKDDRYVATIAEGVKVELAKNAVAGKAEGKGSGKGGRGKKNADESKD